MRTYYAKGFPFEIKNTTATVAFTIFAVNLTITGSIVGCAIWVAVHFLRKFW